MNTKSLLSLAVIACALPSFARAEVPKGWTDNYAQAVETAKAEKKYVLLDFTGSDWCGFCKILDKEVFSTPHFQSWAKKNVVLVQVDFPHQTQLSPEVKTQNDGLMSKYPAKGFPTILVLDTNGKELARESGYHPGTGAPVYVRTLETALKKFGPLPGGNTANVGAVAVPSIFKTTPRPAN
ncbi:MAG: thioredoxin fold domain-containing protein [Chthoniobacter sp.]|uniref:thioredoxin family protein n=1 Tax=Chthoniobacter sp. TaxID=2510640 RepID=UPI0032AA7CA5